MAAVCRAQADWLIGMNGTRAYTTCYFKRLVVGRVQTPTLAMLAERQDKIEHFQKEAFYKVALTDGRLTVASENIANEEAADLLASLCMDSEAVITQVKKEQKKAFPPKLYDLTSLQREANRYFGYTAKKTLDMLQELYEEKAGHLSKNGQPVRDGGYEGYRRGTGRENASLTSVPGLWTAGT